MAADKMMTQNIRAIRVIRGSFHLANYLRVSLIHCTFAALRLFA